ncbi:MAG: helix-turn-helix domain-containing protein [Pseudomonadota bacterium]
MTMSKVGNDIIKGLEQALAHTRGEDIGSVVHEVKLDDIDVKSIRKTLDVTQDELATLLGVSTSGLRKWEQGQRHPRGAARTLLKIMEKEPEAVLRAVGS